VEVAETRDRDINIAGSFHHLHKLKILKSFEYQSNILFR